MSNGLVLISLTWLTLVKTSKVLTIIYPYIIYYLFLQIFFNKTFLMNNKSGDNGM